MADIAAKWQISGEYFENCNCSVVCPCLVSANAPLTSRPTEGYCAVIFGIHIDKGRHGDTTLDGLNVAMVAYTPGPMAEGNWKVAAYIDARASEQQGKALGDIFGGGNGGPMAAFAPLIAENLGVKQVPIAYRVEGKKRSVEIAQAMHAAVRPLPSLREGEEIWMASGHPFAPDKLSLAIGEAGSTFEDYGMRWNNSGRNAHYAPINWGN